MKIIETEDKIVTFDDSPDIQRAVFERVIGFFQKHDAYRGEVIMQRDGPQIEAPEFLADLADDVLNFQVKWKDEE